MRNICHQLRPKSICPNESLSTQMNAVQCPLFGENIILKSNATQVEDSFRSIQFVPKCTSFIRDGRKRYEGCQLYIDSAPIEFYSILSDRKKFGVVIYLNILTLTHLNSIELTESIEISCVVFALWAKVAINHEEYFGNMKPGKSANKVVTFIIIS